VLELLAWTVLLSLLFPVVAVVLVLRYRVIQAILEGYREGGSPFIPQEGSECVGG